MPPDLAICFGHGLDFACRIGAHARLEGDRDGGTTGGGRAAVDEAQDGVDRAFADRCAAEFDAAHPRLGGERNELGVELLHVAAADAILLLGEHDDGAPLRGLVGERGELRGIGELLLADVAQRLELGGLAVAERDGAGLVEQEGVDVARRLHGPAGHGQHVEAHQAVHAGNADRGEQRADGCRDQRDKQRDQHDNGDRAARIRDVARDGCRGEDEDDGQTHEQDVESDLVGRLLALGALDQPDHTIEEGGAGRGGDADADPIGQHLGSAGHRRAVAARLADDRGRFAGDGCLVDRGDALDHLAVGGDVVAGLDQHDVADPQAGAGDKLIVSGIRCLQELGLRLGALTPERVGLRLAAALGNGLREVGEQDRQPQPQDDLEGEAKVAAARDQITNEEDGGQDRDDLEHEHDRVLDQRARIELDECRADRRDDDLAVEQRRHRHLLAKRGRFHAYGSDVSSKRR